MLEPRQRRLERGICREPTPDGAVAKRNPMADLRNYQMRAGAGTRVDTGIDEGLRAYMLKVYNLMALGLAITGLAALGTMMLATTNDPAAAAATLGNGKMLTNLGVALYGSPLRWVVMLAPLGMVFFLSARIHTLSVSSAQTMFWVFAGLMGLSMSSIFLVYTSASIVQTFFITAASFGALSLFGYTTKRDLTGMGSFQFMGLIGVLLASLANMFFQSPMMEFVISIIGVLVFVGLTAWDTQQIKNTYYEVGGNVAVAGKAAIMGALSLYLDFLNIFLFLLRFMGDRR